MNSLKDVFLTYEIAGLKIITDDECCQLLAWLSLYNNNEEFVLNTRLNACIMLAQRRLGIKAGEVPNLELTAVLQNYVMSVKDRENPPKWIKDLEKKYSRKGLEV